MRQVDIKSPSVSIQYRFLLFSCFVVLALTIFRFSSPNTFDLLYTSKGISSESVMEDFQALILFLCLPLCFYIALTVVGRLRKAFFFFVGLVFLIVFLEELAFGQHALALETPSSLKAVNAQQEITIHNLTWIQDSYIFFGGRFNALFVIPTVISFVLAFLWTGFLRGRLKKYWFVTPGFYAAPLFFYCFLIHFVYTLADSSSFGSFFFGFEYWQEYGLRLNDWELGELTLYLGLLLWLVLVTVSTAKLKGEGTKDVVQRFTNNQLI